MIEYCLPDEQGANPFDRRLLCQSALAEGSTSSSNVRRRTNIFTGTCKYTRVSLAALAATDKVDIICWKHYREPGYLDVPSLLGDTASGPSAELPKCQAKH